MIKQKTFYGVRLLQPDQNIGVRFSDMIFYTEEEAKQEYEKHKTLLTHTVVLYVMKSLIPITINKIRGYKNPLIDTRAKVLDINRR